MPLVIELDKVLKVFLYPALAVLFVTSLIVTCLRVTSLVCDRVHLGNFAAVSDVLLASLPNQSTSRPLALQSPSCTG